MRRSPRPFWIVLAAIGAGMILLIVNHDGGTTLGIPNDHFAATLYYGVWALVVAAAIAGSRIPLGEAARNLALWMLVLLALVVLYLYRHEFAALGRIFLGG